MTTTFPTTIDNFSTISAGTKQSIAVGGRDHRQFHNDISDTLEAIEAKIGIGPSAQVPPNIGFLLAADGLGLSSWRKGTHSDLEVGAATQVQVAAGTTSAPTTTSGSPVDMLEMTITMSTVTGTVVWLLFTGTAYNSGAGNTGFFGLDVDGSGITLASVSSPAPGYAYSVAITRLVTGLAAGIHTFKTKWSTSAGTQTMSTTERRLTAIEFRR